MPPITAILQTHNDALHLGRALESLRPCDEILIVDLGSTDATLRVAREYGAVIRDSGRQPSLPDFLSFARNEWIFCILPTETMTESLEASLFEWKLRTAAEVAEVPSCSVVVRAEAKNPRDRVMTSTRLVPRSWALWDGPLPCSDPRSRLLEGELLCFPSVPR
jgi:glycosyltransferase involved in cell wall biosynthesis